MLELKMTKYRGAFNLITEILTVSGRVQGIGFRWSVMNLAHELGVKGSVQNKIDGSVEIVVQGNHKQLTLFKRKLPAASPYAKISAIHAKRISSRKYSSFTVKY